MPSKCTRLEEESYAPDRLDANVLFWEHVPYC
ncbi:hypothetical protein T11_13383 [Trichinella zimbabwensis]|uniref:Uncharacterized protein n=1 Tax=Trichinella zimbabwensis TaxID=268475 RepID=A0A0V1F5F1_9BILA|nr:hypothetical protein T11_13383 [Trichinella zimbabwensis]